ncbi:hypothetical protein D3C81_1349620 [compost metagenome]
MLGRAVVTLQLDDLGAGEVAFEAQDVVHLGPAPAVDRLIVVADAADIAGRGGQQPQPQVLGDVGVLVLVHQNVAEAIAIFRRQISVLRQDGEVVQQQVAEVAGVQRGQPLLIGGVEGVALAVGEVLARRQLLGRPAAVLPVVDQVGQRLGRVLLGVDIGGFEQLLEQPFLIVGVQDGEAGLQPHQFGVTAKDLGRDRVEGAEPAQALGRGADQVGDPLAHLARGLVGEGDDQQFPGLGPARRQDVGQTGGQDAGLARAGAGQDQNRPLGRLDRQPLFGVQAGQVVANAVGAVGRLGAREVGNAGGGQVGHRISGSRKADSEENISSTAAKVRPRWKMARGNRQV